MVVQMKAKRMKIYGVGVNDADYPILAQGVLCKYYRVWQHMMERGYSEKYKTKNPTYRDCSVAKEWHSFMAFKDWMQWQDWRGKNLDKDIIVSGNKLYRKDLCAFVDRSVNTFILDCGSRRGSYPIGVHFCNTSNKFKAQCQNPFSKKREQLGYFDCPKKAHEAWRKRKHELSCLLAKEQTDPRVAHSLMNRYANPL
jgi:hypothetical protein